MCSLVNLISNHDMFAKDWYGMYVREVLGDTSGGLNVETYGALDTLENKIEKRTLEQ